MSTFLTTQQAADRIGISKSTLLRRLRAKKPTPPVIRIDERTLPWRKADVDAWLQARTHDSDEGRRGGQR